jgi:hypothetical protein
MKRLDHLYDRRPEAEETRHQQLYGRRSSEELRALLHKYRELGIPVELLLDPERVATSRVLYELSLKGTPAGRARMAPEVRRLRTAMKAATPLLEFMTKNEWYFGTLSRDVQARLYAYQQIELGLFSAPSEHPGRRVRDPWLKHMVLEIAVRMRQRGVPVKRIIREIVQALGLAGHGDLATYDQVRHIIREARRTDPEFAARFQPRGRIPKKYRTYCSCFAPPLFSGSVPLMGHRGSSRRRSLE